MPGSVLAETAQGLGPTREKRRKRAKRWAGGRPGGQAGAGSGTGLGRKRMEGKGRGRHPRIRLVACRMARAEPPLRLREGLPARRAVGHRGRPSGRTPGGGAVWADASGGRSHRGREGEADMRGEGKGSAEDSLSGGRSPLTGPGGLSGRSASCGFAGPPFPGIALRDRGGWPAGRDGAGRGGRAIRGGSSAGLNATGGLVEESARMAPSGLFGGEDAPAAEGGTRAGGRPGREPSPGEGKRERRT
jgi:hypothetical protein